MNKLARFNTAIAEIVDIPSPTNKNKYVSIAKFVFADDKPNGNKQGIKVEEFPNIIDTAIGMPIKINFVSDFFKGQDRASTHRGSIPIGHITKMEHVVNGDVNELHAEAMLWKDEYPEEIEFLHRAYAENKAPGLSYEIDYEEADIDAEGNAWIKGSTTLAATFVEHPAYGSRTHLLALASLDEDERNAELVALADKIKLEQESDEENTDEGGNLMEKELEEAKAEITRLTAELSAKDSKITDLESALTTTTDERNTAKAELEKIQADSKLEGRVRQYVDAGFTLETDATKADARKAVFASFDDAQWDTYLADLKASKPKNDRQTVFASLSSNPMPRPEVELEGFSGLREEMRGLARPHETN